jgi:hypothetical protein
MFLCFGEKTSKQKVVYNKIQWHFNMFVQDPIVSIAPKKPNSDLRRDVAKKLEKLERRTQRAIIELMRKYIISLHHQVSLLFEISGKFSSPKSMKRENYCTHIPVPVDFALQILRRCESQAAKHVKFKTIM